MELTTADVDYVCELVRQKSAITLDSEKAYLIEARLSTLARREGLTDASHLVANARAGRGELRQKVVEAMTTNETSFFRDQHPFEALRRAVLPALAQARAGSRRLLVWCAASSTGQEPYSIAMLIREALPQLAAWDVGIVATDLSTEVLDRARAGTYSTLEVNRGVPASYLVKYFRRQGANWQLQDEIRRMVDFRCVNLIEPWPDFGRPDVVMLRNVLIYFGMDTKRAILGKLRRVIQPDGYLFLGGGESLLNIDDAFVRQELERASVYRPR